MKLIRLSMLCILALGVVACAELFGVKYQSYLAGIDGGPLATISIPDSVAVSTDFAVSFQTSGGGCSRAGTTQVSMTDNHTAEIRPYDERRMNSQCTSNLVFFRHIATLRFVQVGNATVHLIGAYNDSTITITRTVVVH